MAKFLDNAGVSTLWRKVKSHVSSSISALSGIYAALVHTHTKSDITDLADATDSTGGLMSAAQAQKLAGIAAGAEVNVVAGIQKNGTDVQPDATSRKVNIAVPTKTSDLDNDDHVVKDAAYVHTDVNFTSAKDSKLTGIAAGAQVNVIESIKVNGTALTPSSKEVSITVPTDNASLANGAGYQTEAQVNTLIDSKLTSAIVPKGSSAFASLPTPASSNLGYLYNVSDAFTIDNKFVEYDSANPKNYPAGTNVYVVNAGTAQTPSYKFDVMSGFVDLSAYYNNSNLQVISTSELEEILM